MKAAGIKAFLLMLTIMLTGCVGNVVTDVKAPQNNLIFAQANPYQIKPSDTPQLAEKYLVYYYLPWTDRYRFQTIKSIRSDQRAEMQRYQRYPGYQQNGQYNDQAWINGVVANIDLDKYPNVKRNAITLVESSLRLLPTNKPAYGNPSTPGQGYPFDNLQLSGVKANAPVFVLDTTRDHAWVLVITPYNAVGWIPSNNVAYVDKAFIKRWTHTKYVTPLQEHVPITNLAGQLRFNTVMGQIYPLYKELPNEYQFLIAVTNAKQQAVIELGQLNKKEVAYWPMFSSTKTVALMANQLLNKPYGWGGMDGYRDCSETLMDVFAPFGIWLPRNSYYQARKGGQYISVAGYSNQKKQWLLKKYGTPFYTLVWMPGHIMLYVGDKSGKAYAFHTPWGLHTFRLFGGDGRAVIGRSVITSLDFGNGYWNVKSSYLDKMQGMTLLLPQQDMLKG